MCVCVTCEGLIDHYNVTLVTDQVLSMCDPSTRETEVGGLCVEGQPGLYSKVAFQK